jgi:hypothetical protein
MPEAANVQTTVHGPANRIPMSYRQEKEDSGSDASEDNKSEGSGVDAHHDAASDEDAVALPPEPLNENETIVGISEESCPKPLRLFEAWNASMSKLNAEAAKCAQAAMKLSGVEQPTAVSATKLVASKEMVRSKIAVDMIDIARGLSKSSRNSAELQNLIAGHAEAQQQ